MNKLETASCKFTHITFQSNERIIISTEGKLPEISFGVVQVDEFSTRRMPYIVEAIKDGRNIWLI